MVKISILFFICLSPIAALFSQNRLIISGYVEDEKMGERLPNVTVYDVISKKGVVGNVYGFYSFSFAAGDSVALVFSYVGYYPQQILKRIDKNETVKYSIETG